MLVLAAKKYGVPSHLRFPLPSFIKAVELAPCEEGVFKDTSFKTIGFAEDEEALRFFILVVSVKFQAPVKGFWVLVLSKEADCQVGSVASPLEVKNCPEVPKPFITPIPVPFPTKR